MVNWLRRADRQFWPGGMFARRLRPPRCFFWACCSTPGRSGGTTSARRGSTARSRSPAKSARRCSLPNTLRGPKAPNLLSGASSPPGNPAGDPSRPIFFDTGNNSCN